MLLPLRVSTRAFRANRAPERSRASWVTRPGRFVLAGVTLIAPFTLVAQSARPAPDTSDVRAPSQLSVNLGAIFPAMRELGQPPAVGVTGQLTTVTGAGATMPVTPATALIDVRILRSQLSSIFPLSDAYYPTDSIRRVRVQRAAEWVARLKSAAVPVDDRQLVSLAQLAMMAEQDSVARRLFDARIADRKSVV